MTIEGLKRKIVKKYGKEPTITYYYYLWNVVDYCGEKRVRESFDSIKGQGDEVIIGDYNSTDNTKELCKEYGFKFINIEKDENCVFPESKIRNKVIINSSSNFLVPLNINVTYPKKMTNFIREWIENNSIIRRMLKLRYMFQSKDGIIRKPYGFSMVFYKPYLLRARGYDERTFYASGSQLYGVMLFKEVYKLRPSVVNLNLIHKYHNHIKIPMLHKIFGNVDHVNRRKKVRKIISTLRTNLQENFNEGIKHVENSYW